MNDFGNFFRTGKVSYNMLRYIPGLAKVCYQGQLHSTETKRKTYKNKKNIEFNVQLTEGHYTIFQKEINIKRYRNDIPTLPLTNTFNTYRYSDKMLKPMPKDTL